jgi:hypothetical protein
MLTLYFTYEISSSRWVAILRNLLCLRSLNVITSNEMVNTKGRNKEGKKKKESKMGKKNEM